MTEVADLSVGAKHLDKWESAPLQFFKERMDRKTDRNRLRHERGNETARGIWQDIAAPQAEVNEGQDSEREQTFQMEMRAERRNEGWVQIENHHHGNLHWNRGRELRKEGERTTTNAYWPILYLPKSLL